MLTSACVTYNLLHIIFSVKGLDFWIFGGKTQEGSNFQSGGTNLLEKYEVIEHIQGWKN